MEQATKARDVALVDPIRWIEQHREVELAEVPDADPTPMIYVAHPVAAQPGEVLGTCMKCKADHLFAPRDPVDFRHVCDHDAPIRQATDMASIVGYNVRQARAWWR